MKLALVRNIFRYKPVALAMSAYFLSSCAIIGLKQHIENMETHGVVTSASFSPPPNHSKPTYALAWVSTATGLRSAGLQRIGDDGVASFILRINRQYYVGAFTDLNDNHSYDVGEPGDYVAGVTPVSLGDPNASVRGAEANTAFEPQPAGWNHNRYPGGGQGAERQLDLALEKLDPFDDPDFTTDAAGSGLWRPLKFLSHNQPGIYFTERTIPIGFPFFLSMASGARRRTCAIWRSISTGRNIKCGSSIIRAGLD